MKIKFWGTRGSIPVSVTTTDIRHKLHAALLGTLSRPPLTKDGIDAYLDTLGFDVTGTFGGHSSCVQIDVGSSECIILDMGSGARPLAQHLMERNGQQEPKTYHVFMSHLHWDHIMGFPFFTPLYIPGNRIIVHSCHVEVEAAFRRQMGAPSFPVDFSQLAAEIEFVVLKTGVNYQIGGVKVSARKQRHTGDSYGWRFEHDGRSVVYSTDSEHGLFNHDDARLLGCIEFFRDADAVIFDAMYSLAEAASIKADWGHSSNVIGVELCQRALAKRLIMFHHEPAYNDTQIATVLTETRRFEEITRQEHRLEVYTAWDGWELTV